MSSTSIVSKVIEKNNGSTEPPIPRLTRAPLDDDTSERPVLELHPLDEQIIAALDSIGVKIRHARAIAALVHHSAAPSSHLLDEAQRVINSLR